MTLGLSMYRAQKDFIRRLVAKYLLAVHGLGKHESYHYRVRFERFKSCAVS